MAGGKPDKRTLRSFVRKLALSNQPKLQHAAIQELHLIACEHSRDTDNNCAAWIDAGVVPAVVRFMAPDRPFDDMNSAVMLLVMLLHADPRMVDHISDTARRCNSDGLMTALARMVVPRSSRHDAESHDAESVYGCVMALVEHLHQVVGITMPVEGMQALLDAAANPESEPKMIETALRLFCHLCTGPDNDDPTGGFPVALSLRATQVVAPLLAHSGQTGLQAVQILRAALQSVMLDRAQPLVPCPTVVLDAGGIPSLNAMLQPGTDVTIQTCAVCCLALLQTMTRADLVLREGSPLFDHATFQRQCAAAIPALVLMLRLSRDHYIKGTAATVLGLLTSARVPSDPTIGQVTSPILKAIPLMFDLMNEPPDNPTTAARLMHCLTCSRGSGATDALIDAGGIGRVVAWLEPGSGVETDAVPLLATVLATLVNTPRGMKAVSKGDGVHTVLGRIARGEYVRLAKKNDHSTALAAQHNARHVLDCV